MNYELGCDFYFYQTLDNPSFIITSVKSKDINILLPYVSFVLI